MRLVAVEIPSAVTGGAPGFVKLAAISALLGANDSGKSRILRSIARALDFGYVDRAPLFERPRLFVELEQSPERWLDEERDDAGRRELPLLPDRTFFGRPLVGDRFEFELRTMGSAQATGSTDALDRRLLVLRAWAGLADEAWDPLIQALRGSQRAVIRPVEGGWALEWCLPAWKELEPDVQACLTRPGMQPERVDEPIVATPLLPWAVGDRGLPRVRVVPKVDPTLEADVNIRLELEAHHSSISPTVWSEMVRRLFERLAVERLPPFVTLEYDVATDDSGTTHFVRRRCGTRLTATEVADGFRIWVEMALIDASETLSDVLAQITAILDHDADWPSEQAAAGLYTLLYRHGQDFTAALTSDPDATTDLLASIAPLLARERHSREAYSYVGSSSDKPLTVVAGTGEQSGSLFLVDEPERHLHPRLQRQAALWLQRVADENLLHGQILLATHSVSLMGLSGAVEYTEVRRPDAATIVVPVAQRQLDVLDSLSNELGLDRGELITLKRVFLFVEGAVDKLVFEGLFGDRLRDAGIHVMAMHGTTKMQAIIESDLLFASYRQPIAVIVDNIVRDALPSANDIAALESLCAKRGADNLELRKAAELRKNAYYAGRSVKLDAIPTPDIIAELDAEVIRTVQGTDYPGYEHSRSAWLQAGQTQSWKSFCVAKGWFRPSPDDIRPVVAMMRDRAIEPPELARLVRWVEQLADEGSPRTRIAAPTIE